GRREDAAQHWNPQATAGVLAQEIRSARLDQGVVQMAKLAEAPAGNSIGKRIIVGATESKKPGPSRFVLTGNKGLRSKELEKQGRTTPRGSNDEYRRIFTEMPAASTQIKQGPKMDSKVLSRKPFRLACKE